MSKFIYKSEKPYSEDINDLIEDQIEKGGVGSGVRGHKTNRPENLKSKKSKPEQHRFELVYSGKMDEEDIKNKFSQYIQDPSSKFKIHKENDLLIIGTNSQKTAANFKRMFVDSGSDVQLDVNPKIKEE